ncbi:MAG: SH3 domain-containing protein [Chloroflexi bacterium]|nr:SH3 domain-containing protein [Chloroflexota bacterium]
MGLTACQPTPTPTPALTPTPTRRNTRTPFPTLTPRASPSPTTAPLRAVVTDTLRVRAQPNTTAHILGRLRQDQTVLLLSRTDDSQWFSIEYPEASGQIGWIFGEVVIPQGDVKTLPIGVTAPKPPEGSIFAVVKTEGDPLRMRAGPATNYEVLARIPDTTRILLVAKSPDGTWYQTIFPAGSGQRGWVSGEFVTLASSPASLQIAEPPPTPTPGPTAVPRPTRAAKAARSWFRRIAAARTTFTRWAKTASCGGNSRAAGARSARAMRRTGNALCFIAPSMPRRISSNIFS